MPNPVLKCMCYSRVHSLVPLNYTKVHNCYVKIFLSILGLEFLFREIGLI